MKRCTIKAKSPMGNKNTNPIQKQECTQWTKLASIPNDKEGSYDCNLISIENTQFIVVGFYVERPTLVYTYDIIQNKWITSSEYDFLSLPKYDKSINYQTVTSIDGSIIIKFGEIRNISTVLYEYESQDEDQLSIKPGEEVFVLDCSADLNGWALVENMDKKEGYIPAEYMRSIQNDDNIGHFIKTNHIFIEKDYSKGLSLLKCPMEGNYAFLLSFGYIRRLKYVSILPNDVIYIIINMY
eukprot:293990_1